MTNERLWSLSLLLLLGSLFTGRFAIFTNGGNGNGRWYLLFWVFCTSLFCASSLLLAKSLRLEKQFTIILVVFLTLVGSICTSPIALMGFPGILLIPYAVFCIVLLIVVKAKAGKMK